MDSVTRCADILSKTQRLLVITGAGISAESGISTYRGTNGAYVNNPDLPSIMSAEGLLADRDKIWKHIEEIRLQCQNAEPNAAHRILAQWKQEQRFSEFLIATQNIDGLHQKAGSDRVSELHGSLWQLARPRTKSFTEDDQFSEDLKLMDFPEMRDEILQRWSEENQQEIWEDRTVPFPHIPPFDDPAIRPNILLFNEPYGSRLVWVEDFIKRKPDTILVIGCSGQVALLPQLLAQCREANPDCAIININPHEDCAEDKHEYVGLGASECLTAMNQIMV
jgi:NAD-dependent SIR2 family protein deacetylase